MAFEGRPHYDFISLSKEIEPPTTIYDHYRTLPFRFGNIEKAYETYHGKHVSVRYFVRVALERKFLPPLVKEHEIIVQSCQPEMGLQSDPIKMEVGIEDCLHIEFEYGKRHYHLEDVICGKVHFLLVSRLLHVLPVTVHITFTSSLTSSPSFEPLSTPRFGSKSNTWSWL